jgi:hypothetical protein
LKKTTFAPVPYKPGPPPPDLPASAQRYLDDELNRIAALLQIQMSMLSGDSLSLNPMTAPPPNPRARMIVYTDATTWDPGSGEGYYYFNNHGVWTPLG